jgi:hypothetical protein
MFQSKCLAARKRASTWRCGFGAIASLGLMSGAAFAAPPDSMPIWRVQVRFITADVSDAGTDSNVWVQLNDNNKTYLDSGRDDRERNRDEVYELRLDGVNKLSDIDFFKVQKNGDDGWALRRIILIVNNSVIFEESFPSSPHWMDNEDGDTRIRFVDDIFMRPRSQWVNYIVPTRPNIVPAADTTLRVEALHGDYTSNGETHNLGFKEVGHSAVAMNAISLDTWRVHVGLNETDTWLIGQDIHLRFNLKIGCASGRPNFTVSNVNASSAFEPYTEQARGSARSFVNGDFKPRLNEMMKGFRYGPLCPTIALSPEGDIHFTSRWPVFEYPVHVFESAQLLDIDVSTGDGIKTFAKANFVTAVATKLDVPKAELSFELPAQIAAYDTIVEVRPAGSPATKDPRDLKTRSPLARGEYRTLNATLKQRKDGTTALIVNDRLVAGQTMEYTLHLVYQPKEDGAGQIVTTVQPLDDETLKLITPLKSVTDFSFKNGEVFPEGTSTTASHYVGDKIIWTEPKPADGK